MSVCVSSLRAHSTARSTVFTLRSCIAQDNSTPVMPDNDCCECLDLLDLIACDKYDDCPCPLVAADLNRPSVSDHQVNRFSSATGFPRRVEVVQSCQLSQINQIGLFVLLLENSTKCFEYAFQQLSQPLRWTVGQLTKEWGAGVECPYEWVMKGSNQRGTC